MAAGPGLRFGPGWLRLRPPKGAEKGNVRSIPLCFQCQILIQETWTWNIHEFGVHRCTPQRSVVWLWLLKLRIFLCHVWFRRTEVQSHFTAQDNSNRLPDLTSTESHGCSANLPQFATSSNPCKIISLKIRPFAGKRCKHLTHLFSYDQSHS